MQRLPEDSPDPYGSGTPYVDTSTPVEPQRAGWRGRSRTRRAMLRSSRAGRTYTGAGIDFGPDAAEPYDLPTPPPPSGLGGTVRDTTAVPLTDGERKLELREEELIARKELRELGEVRVRKEVEEVPGRLEVDALREEVEVEHVPVGKVVNERVEPWEEDGDLIVPVYEEQVVMVKRLVLREQLRIRRVSSTERQLFEDTLRRERVVVEDPDNTGLIHEQYATDELEREQDDGRKPQQEEGNFLEHLVRKAFQ
jgi:uncharacterized protein (TIGR02271 family)